NIPVAEEFDLPMERHLGLVEGHDAGDADHYGIDLETGPVVGPFLDVEHDGIVLRHVQLPEAPDLPLPGNVVRGSGEQRTRHGSGRDDNELAAVDLHY